jgi:hypothetical protein
VADQHQVVEGRVLPVRVELRKGLAQGVAQLTGGEQDRITRVVGEEPELDVVAQHRIVLQLIHHISPARRARNSAMDQHHRHTAAPVRVEHPEPLGEGPPDGGQKGAAFGLPHRGAFEDVGQRGAGLELQRDRLRGHVHAGGLVRRIQLQPPLNVARGQALGHGREAHEGGDGDFDARRDALARRLASGPHLQRAQLRRQRRPHTRLPVAVAQPPHLELGYRDEATHAVPAPDKLLRVDGEGERAEGQRLAAWREEDAVPLGCREHEGQAEIVEIGRASRPRIEGLRDAPRSISAVGNRKA